MPVAKANDSCSINGSMKNIVIVESPAKARTIEKFLGKDYKVVASFGHVRDLPKTGMSIDIEHGFLPSYEVSADKKRVITELKKLTKDADTIWLASDEDREGEAIAWHLQEALKLKPASTKRIVFHEITEPAIKAAIAQPRGINQPLVDAQQARRVLDRIVGYELSPVLWKKVQRGLSAGRVQSVAVRLIVEREQEIEAHVAKATFKIVAEFTADNKSFRAELTRKIESEEEAKNLLAQLGRATFKVQSVETKPAKRSPAAPFTTSTLQQEASRKLGFSVRQTMVLAQRLYEAGHITYMRTDSVNLSEIAISAAAAEIERRYGKDFVATRRFTTKSAGAQEAHEAIRPTQLGRDNIAGERGEQRLYELIWKRTIASQMAEARLEKTTAFISNSLSDELFKATGEAVVFEGFLSVYLEGKDDEDEDTKLLPKLLQNLALPFTLLQALQQYDRPKPRYTEASLVKKLEEEGIGRPSTYAPTISTIQDRGYVEKGDLEGKPRPLVELSYQDGGVERSERQEMVGADRNKLYPTEIGTIVTAFLIKHFAEVVDYRFTAKVEEEFDSISQGQKAWNAMIQEFYGPFHTLVEKAENLDPGEGKGERKLGTDPNTGRPVFARLGRFGPMVQIGSKDDEEKPLFAGIPAGHRLADITLEKALELFTLPREVGNTASGEPIQASVGRFGPYLKYGNTYVSIKSPDDPFTITQERARELITEKAEAEAKRLIKEFAGTTLKVVNGRFGPYITDGKKNAKIPKDTAPDSLTLQQCQTLLEEAPAAKPRRKISRRKTR